MAEGKEQSARTTREHVVGIATRAGNMPAFVVHPDQDAAFPAAILYMDFWGIREELYGVARRVAAAGYCCVVPDLYYRQGVVRNELRDRQGQMISLNRLEEAVRTRVLAPLKTFSDAEAMDDTDAILNFLAHHPSASAGAVGCFGYCLGGRLALRAAGNFPEKIKAAASLHGTRLVAAEADSPHLLAAKIQGTLYCGFAADDPYTPETTPMEIAAAMRASRATYRYEVHAGTQHGYALPDRDIHDAKATERDWQQIFAMFRDQL
jgi:carboxymethylenebutenolidase